MQPVRFNDIGRIIFDIAAASQGLLLPVIVVRVPDQFPGVKLIAKDLAN